MSRRYSGCRGFLWGVVCFRWILWNKNLPREVVVETIKRQNDIGLAGAEWRYALAVGVIDERGDHVPVNPDSGLIEVNTKSIKRRRLYMREGDIEWWYGSRASFVKR